MSKYYFVTVITALLLLSSNLSLAKEPKNITLSKQAIVRYHDSGEYSYDIGTTIHKAKEYLAKKIIENKANKHKHKLAIVLDIDDTAISNYKALKQRDFAAIPSSIDKDDRSTVAPAIPAVLALYNYAKENGVAVFFMSGRGRNVHRTTVAELKNAGYKNWNKIYLCNTRTIHCTDKMFKINARKNIIKMGYDIALNVNDQYKGLKGGYADYNIKLPNPYYFLT